MKLDSILPLINSPSDIKGLTTEQLNKLSEEIREFLIDTVSETGGHLSSNLGVVELTLALHLVFNTPYDKIVWDVGHQSYIHKILTGRKGRFNTLRQLNGISGFPKMNESEHDCFNTGHSSTSVSAALGMARARDLKKEKNAVIAVIGDGALTGGMAFEALNDAGRSTNNLIVILNDNEMSIDKNVGALSSCLNRIRTKPIYFKVKKDIDLLLHKIPAIGNKLSKTIGKAKGTIKYLMLPGMFFEELGFKYIGPVDGHNINDMRKVLLQAKEMEGPILIHALTQKGKGYLHAEKSPHIFHGISPFDVETGELKKIKTRDYSAVFGESMVEIAKKNKKVVAITAAMPHGTGLEQFSIQFPERFFDVGIAEQHAITFASGLAAEGIKPVFAVYSSFLQRAYDQIVHDVCMPKLPVVFAIDRAGIVGNDGETHHGLFDLSFLSHIPNMTVMAPKDFQELKQMLNFAVNFNGPIALRYPRGQAKDLDIGEIQPVEYGKAQLMQHGNDITIVACGRMVSVACKVAKEIIKFGLNADVINVRFVKPLDEDMILTSVKKTKKIVTIEDNVLTGGLGSAIMQLINNNELNDINLRMFGYPDQFIQQGNTDELDNLYGMDYKAIACTLLNTFTLSKKFKAL